MTPESVLPPVAAVPLIGVKELARRLGIAKGTIYNWVYLKRLPYLKIGGALRFDPSKIEALLANWTKLGKADRR